MLEQIKSSTTVTIKRMHAYVAGVLFLEII
jgi:hypothetical protein